MSFSISSADRKINRTRRKKEEFPARKRKKPPGAAWGPKSLWPARNPDRAGRLQVAQDLQHLLLRLLPFFRRHRLGSFPLRRFRLPLQGGRAAQKGCAAENSRRKSGKCNKRPTFSHFSPLILSSPANSPARRQWPINRPTKRELMEL